MLRLVMLVGFLVVFTAYSGFVAWNYGFFGFLEVAVREPWAGQMFLDLSAMLILFGVWMWGDAKQHGFNRWFWLSSLVWGSPGPVAYLIRRELHLRGRR